MRTASRTTATSRSVCSSSVPATRTPAALCATRWASRTVAQRRARHAGIAIATAINVASRLRPTPDNRRSVSRLSRVSASTWVNASRAVALACASVCARSGSASAGVSTSASSPSTSSTWPCGSTWTVTTPCTARSSRSRRIASVRRARRSGATPKYGARKTATLRLRTTTAASVAAAPCATTGCGGGAGSVAGCAIERPAINNRKTVSSSRWKIIV